MTDLPALASSQHYPTSTLYVVATPLGNAADITLRALHVLGLVDAVACEDTRNTQQLLGRYGLAKPLLAAHQHNEHEAAQKIVARLQLGERVALVTDAGTPAVSDPGSRLVAAVRAAGFRAVPLPGASAVVTALSVAGDVLDPDESGFAFAGFLPTKAAQRDAVLARLCRAPVATAFYESPHRIAATLAALAQILPPARKILIGRELTKLFEDVAVMSVAEAPGWLAADPQHARGEFVLVVAAAEEKEGADAAVLDVERLLALLVDAVPTKVAAKIAAELSGLPKNQLYEQALALKNQE